MHAGDEAIALHEHHAWRVDGERFTRADCSCPCTLHFARADEGDVVADIYRHRVLTRGKGSEVWGWGTAYGAPQKPGAQPPGGKS